ncbi:hypothetical protein BDQ17DRAFT_1332877 [Cyathus striatus]|nr:hypothetical protein BDQ17DRAFT_1332877 [Cyathus striatus]
MQNTMAMILKKEDTATQSLQELQKSVTVNWKPSTIQKDKILVCIKEQLMDVGVASYIELPKVALIIKSCVGHKPVSVDKIVHGLWLRFKADSMQEVPFMFTARIAIIRGNIGRQQDDSTTKQMGFWKCFDIFMDDKRKMFGNNMEGRKWKSYITETLEKDKERLSCGSTKKGPIFEFNDEEDEQGMHWDVEDSTQASSSIAPSSPNLVHSSPCIAPSSPGLLEFDVASLATSILAPQCHAMPGNVTATPNNVGQRHGNAKSKKKIQIGNITATPGNVKQRPATPSNVNSRIGNINSQMATSGNVRQRQDLIFNNFYN